MKLSSKISLRKANFSDIEFLWYLRNQPDVYKYFRQNRKISWEEHIKWILPILLGTSDKEILIIQNPKLPVGQIRFDYKDFDISISLLKEFQGQGIAKRALVLFIKKIKKQKEFKYLSVQIHKKNLSSLKLFKKLGFRLKTKKGIWLRHILKL